MYSLVSPSPHCLNAKSSPLSSELKAGWRDGHSLCPRTRRYCQMTPQTSSKAVVSFAQVRAAERG